MQQCLRINLTYVTQQDDRALALVAAGVGVAIVPEHFDMPGIVKRPLTEVSATRCIGFEWGKSDNQDEIDRLMAFAATARWP